MKTSTRRAAPLAALAAFTLVLGACGGDDDDDAAAATSEDDGGDAAEGGDEESIEVDNLGDMPDECVDAVGDFLERIEPIVEDVDFENADFSAFEEIGAEISAEASEMGDEELEARCAQYTFGSDEDDIEALKEIARDRAPGAVAYIEWIEQLQQDFSEISIPDISIPDISLPDISIPDISIPDITIPDITIPDISAAAADVPQDCASAIAYFDDLIADGKTMMDLPVGELAAIGTVTQVISTDCSVDQMTEFFNRADVQAFMSG